MKLNALLVDISILGPLGWEFLERVCGMLPDLGVVVCTQGSTVAQRVRGLRLGADDWIAKPSHPEEVMARIEAVVRRRRRSQPQGRRRARGRGRDRDPRRPVPGVRLRPHARADPPRVRAPACPRRGERPGDRARGDLPAGLGLRDGPRRPLGRRLHPQAAREAPEGTRRAGATSTPISASATGSSPSRLAGDADRSPARRAAADALAELGQRVADRLRRSPELPTPFTRLFTRGTTRPSQPCTGWPASRAGQRCSPRGLRAGTSRPESTAHDRRPIQGDL